MTRTQAWRKVAEAFGTPPEQRTSEQAGRTFGGICLAMIRCGQDSRPIVAFGHSMGLWGWWWLRLDRDVDSERALFADLMAAMTQRERNQLEPGL